MGEDAVNHNAAGWALLSAAGGDMILRDRRTDAALAELARVRRQDYNNVIDAIGLMIQHGEIAAREKRVDEATRLFECALAGYVMFASSASSGGEGMARTADVIEMKARISRLKGAG